MATLHPSIASDEEIDLKEAEEDDKSVSDGDEVDGNFDFGGILGEDGGDVQVQKSQDGWSFQSALDQSKSKGPARMDVASLISAKRKALKQVSEESDNESDKDSDNNNNNNNDDSDSSSDDDEGVDDAKREMEEDIVKTKAGKDDGQGDEDDQEDEDTDASSSDEEDEAEAAKAAAFYENQSTSGQTQQVSLFVELKLSRPLLRGVAAMGFTKPTPIQAACIPVALAGKDICASAVTGSGKTAAFSLPILERLLHRTGGSSRALILTPTRELAAQCLGMISSLSQFTKLRAALIVGGSKNLNAQAAELRTNPDIIIATPGRILDHARNTAAFSLSDLEFLVLDEADRLLDLGFQEEVIEIVKSCPVQRQTLLFSATMNTKVDDLIHLSLKRPVRIRVSDKNGANASNNDVEVAPRLEQEFIRIRSGNEGINREAMLLALLTRTFTTQTIVFFDLKTQAHKLMILCGLCGIKCAELHGNLTQPQRLEALESFRKGEVNVLLATDLAGRGIDIQNVETVINFEMPSQVSTYIHRIGRTARAGRGGRSCTLIGEGRRHLMKSVIKDAVEKKQQKVGKSGGHFKSGAIRSRSIPAAVVAHFVSKIKSLEPHVKDVQQAEAVAKLDRLADMEATRAQNLIEHSHEIMSRPKREWFASTKQKERTKEAVAEKQALIREKAGTGTHRMTRKKRRAREAIEALNTSVDDGDDNGKSGSGKPPDQQLAIKSAARAAKRKQQQIDREASAESIIQKSNKKAKKKKAPTDNAVGDSSLFKEEKVAHTKKAQPEERAKSSYHFRGDNPADIGKSKGKKKGAKAFKSKSKYKRR